MRICLLIALLLQLSFASAQKTVKDILQDPVAKKLLEQSQKKYSAGKSVELKFTQVVAIPEQKETSETGTIIQAGESYSLKLPRQWVLSNGKATWVYDKDKKEIEIHDAADKKNGEINSPLDVLGLYKQGSYAYSRASDDEDKSAGVQYIEFKPLDKSNELSKIRLGIDKKTYSLKAGKIFYKDGTRVKLTLLAESFNKSYPAKTFELNPKDFPGVHVEDLRLNDK